jgi:hypothetical protein
MPNVRIGAFFQNRSTILWWCREPNGEFARKFQMADDRSPPAASQTETERKPLPPAAQRALAEAEARRKAAEANAKPAPKEFQGPKGPEPTRFGDWEKKGIASDF